MWLPRKGKEIEMRPNRIQIYDLDLNFNGIDEVEFRVSCSKGTYIRSLANDIGKALESGGHLTKLERTRSGEFLLSDAHSIEYWLDQIHNFEVQEL